MPLDPQIGNQTVVIESPGGEILGFRRETLGQKGEVLVDIRVLASEKTFHRANMAIVDKDALDVDLPLPAYISTVPKGERFSPEDLRLFNPAPSPEPDLGKEVVEAIDKLVVVLTPSKPSRPIP